MRAFSGVALLGLLMLLGSPDFSQAISFDLTAGGDFGAAGNKGVSTSATNDGLTLTLSALTMIPDDELPLFGGSTGTVFIAPVGGGVQTLDGLGGPGINGVGGYQDEALIFDFSIPVVTTSTVLTFSRYLIPDDGVHIYLDTESAPTLSNSLIEANLICVGSKCTLDFSDPDLAAALAGISSFSTLVVRADGATDWDEGNFFVKELTVVATPEPATLLLFGFGLAGLGARRWARRRKPFRSFTKKA